MKKCTRKRNSKYKTANGSFIASHKCQANISKYFARQQGNKQPSFVNGLPEPSISSENDTSVLSSTTLSSACQSLKISSDYKENCIKPTRDSKDCSLNAAYTKKFDNKIVNNGITKAKFRKQMLLSQNSQLTDYFPVRRSNRKPLSSTKKEKQTILEHAILSGIEEGFEVKEFPGKGRGVITKRPFKRGDFVLEYYGELIDYEEAKKRESVYASSENTGCYMYYFTFMNKRFCIDATKETNRLGRLVNHSKKGNLKTQPFFIKECPHLILVACRDIDPGEELSYDYGDRRKIAVESHPWLAL